MNEIFDIILDFYIRKPIVGFSVMAVIAIGLVVCTLILVSQNRMFERTAKGFMMAMDAAKKSTERRLEEEERLQQEYGNREKKNMFYRMDEILYHAGIKEKIPWVTVEFLLLFVGLVMLASLFIVMKFSGLFVMGMATAVLIMIMVLAVLKVLCYIRNRQVEDSLLQFANLIENYSRSSDDIVGIFGKVYRYLEEPLRSAVAECYSQATMSGDFSKACNHLSKVIGNSQLSILLSNLEICSRHEANYEAVTKTNKVIIREHLSEKAIRREMANSARIQVAVLLGIGIVILSMINSMTSGVMFQSLLHTKLGNVILTGLLIVIVFVAYKLLTMGQDQ